MPPIASTRREEYAGLFRKALRVTTLRLETPRGGSHPPPPVRARWRNTVSGRGLNGRMHYLCSNQSQRRPRYQPADRVSSPSAAVPQAGRVACFVCASGSGSVLNFSVLHRKGLLVACLDSLGESGEYFIFSDICSQVFLPRYTIFPYKMIPKMIPLR